MSEPALTGSDRLPPGRAGVVALIVGAVGVDNIMIISVAGTPLGDRPPFAPSVPKA